ncbi:hypothetical protein [Thermobrachium celere]|uniref:Uncharacterized protein n=1 Tax=Thermobrachium celere DSM 8682 TaxID=941824 RepID=R7RTB5_9CLOT|nr:hypothetical protein [Thermobrachium celere]GFR35452.1 hypothetical protein TCEA9_12640 [Thermobrachium celere]CDF59284.1 hypothetical protein TCEL_02356 [Thermobrachium celere DSM 8682]
MEREEIIVELEQYFEAAGFDQVYINKLKNMSDDELKELYESLRIENDNNLF